MESAYSTDKEIVKFSQLAAQESVVLTTNGAANDEKYVNMTFPF